MPSQNFTLKFGTERHRKILHALRDRVKISRDKMQDMYEDFKQSEDLYRAYLPEREVDAERRVARENSGEHSYRTIVLPFSYAMLLAAHTYWTSVFFARTPVFQFMASHGMVKGNTKAVEAHIDYQMRVGRMLPPLYQWLLDVGRYGLGVIHEEWVSETRRIASIVEEPKMFMGLIPIGGAEKKKIVQTVKGYEGNKLRPIRPQHWFPDTRLPLEDYQRGEFCGHYVEIGWNELVQGEDDGLYFNIDILRKKRMKGTGGTGGMPGAGEGSSSFLPEEGSEDAVRADPTPVASVPKEHITNLSVLPAYKLCVRLIPADWGLGSGKLPELWQFVFGMKDDVILQAMPRGELHGEFPYSTLHLEQSAYELTSRGMMQIGKPLQDVMDWLFNTHMYNVRKTLNNQVIVDPSKLWMRDVLDPKAGGVWKLKPAAYGTNPAEAYAQVQMSDITKGHIGDGQLVATLLQRALGVSDPVVGGDGSSTRKTATEIRTDTAFSTNRLKTQAEYFSAMGFAPLAMRLLQNTQQYYDDQMMFRIAGDLMEPGAQDLMTVTPEDIAGFFDFMPVDGTLPIDRFAQANLWRELLGQLRFFPDLMAQWDIGGIFGHVMQIAGLKNVNQFKIQVQPDDAIAAAVQAGNMVQSGDGNGGNAGTGSGTVRDADSAGRVPEPGQLSGMGTTG